MSFTPIYEKNLDTSLCHIDTIQLNELDVTGYTYSGITLILNYTGFTSHFDTTGHTYSNVILNNDIYTYTGLTDEIHYFEIYDFYSDGTPSIDPLLTGLTEDNVISGFTTNIISCGDLLSGYTGTCCPTQVVKSNLPWVAITNEGGGSDNCEPFIARRTEKGWTLDYVFNKDGITGWTNSVFFYTGVRDEYDPANYGDNNLSFAFTNDGRIKWTSYRYSGYCDTVSGYTEMYYISTGQTFPLCTGGTSNDFNITITFERYNEYTTDCDLANEGGWNDLINTGVTSTTGSTIIEDTQIEKLNAKWLKERNKRLGTLKIYHNGRPLQIEVPLLPISNFRNLPVYKVKDFEEIILSDRGFQPFVHAVGGGVTGSGNLHNSVCCYSIKYAAYFEDVMTAQYIRDKYLNTTKPSYSITECWEDCTDDIMSSVVDGYPFDLMVTFGSPTANISWTIGSTNHHGHKIERSSDGGLTYSLIATVTGNTSTYIDTAVGEEYLYRVRAYRGVKYSNYSNVDAVKPFVFQIVTSSPNEIITIPHISGYTYDYIIDYNDDTELLNVNNYNDNNCTHLYVSGGTYNIKIFGTCESFYTEDTTPIRSIIKNIISWGDVGIKQLSLKGCYNLISISGATYNGLSDLETLSYTFSGCSITSIPSDIFRYCTNVENFSGVFMGCSFITYIPENLFIYNPLVTTFESSFSRCGILSIPSNLFTNNLRVTNFNSTFNLSTSISGYAPELWTRTGVTGLNCFYMDDKLSNYNDIPNIWKGIPDPTPTPTPTPTGTPTPTPTPTPTGTTFDDWYLPLPDELSFMYMNLKSEGVGDFTNDNYWSSFEGGAAWAYAYDLTDPSTLNLLGKDELPCRVRASRLFIGVLDEYFIRDIGPAGGLIYYIEDNYDETYTYHEAAPFDQSTGCTWSNIVNAGCNTTNDTLNDGIANTLKIINQVGHTSSAAKLCDDLIIIV